MDGDVTRRAVDIPPPVADVRRTVLPNGVRVLTDTVPGASSATLAVWVGVGGRDEPDERAGSSHFLEHLLFKGTDRFDPLQIAHAIDDVGGDMNAYTSSEYTAYFARVPAPEYDVAADILFDVVASPALDGDEFDGEREVILEELAAADDDPEDLVGVRLFESLFPGHPLGREVLGSRDSIDALRRDDVASFFSQWYQPTNLVVTGSGLVDHDQIVSDVAARFGDRESGSAPVRELPPCSPAGSTFDPYPGDVVHLAMGWRTNSAVHPDRFALALLNHVLGSGPSSRLFQQAREERGLTYSISSGASLYSDVGALSVQSATTSAKAAELIGVVDEQIARLAAEGVTAAELARAKRSVRGGLLIGLEDSSSRGARLGIAETIRGAVTPIAAHLEAIDAVTLDDVRRVAAQIFSVERCLAVVGPEEVADLAH